VGLFEKIFRPREAEKSRRALYKGLANFAALTAYQPQFTTWNGALYENALIRAAIDATARHVSKLKVEVRGSAQPSLQTHLRQGPNQWQTWSQFLYRTSTILDCNNTAFIVPVFDADMEITGYYPVLPMSCNILEYAGELWLRYQFSSGQIGAVEMRKCAVLTRYQYKDDFFGSSNHALDETMDLIHMQHQGIKEAVKNSSTYRFMARLNNFAAPEDLAEERQRFTRKNLSADAEANNGVLLFPNTYEDIQQLTAKAYDVDAAQLELIQTNIYNYFGVNEDVLQNKAYGDKWSAFYEGRIEAFSIQFSEAMTAAMFSPRERANGNLLMATSNRLQYLSNADKLSVSSQMADRGIMTRNEIREIWNLPPVTGGDVPTIRGEYYLLGADGSVTRRQDDLTGGLNNADSGT